jgi:predicted phage tail protein
MGAAAHLDITGDKGGESKPKTPVEAPDSLQSTNIAKLLLAVGEGEFDGVPTARDIYLDNTPIVDASGNVNFPGVKWEWRSGSIEQEYIQGIPAVESETAVNIELRSDNPFVRTLSNTQLSAVRVRMSWPRLAQQDSSGNTNGYRIEYAIDIATDGGAYVEAHLGAVDGKTTNGYQRSVRVDLPKATSGWMMRVRRLTPNANKGAIADTMTIAGYTEIIDEKLRYPNTALLYIEFDAQQFQNIPAVTVDCNAKRWPVPSNYDSVARTYSGVWDGTFKQAWTNNPAFVTYGLCVEDRFGLGKRIKSWMVDKWEMYRIAQYCDQLVPDGVGGQEPRFLCDLNLQGRAEAWTLLRDLSAIYRGMVYWAHGSLFMQADMPRAQDIDYVFTRANVIDGEFVYGGAERSTHYSRALVSYDNPANNYDTDVIPVTDNALQRRYRDRPIELSAIGCTRASEAQRRGKWALLSNSQDRTVTFKTGMEGRIPLPGYVIPVADELVAGRPNGGRISSAAGRVVTLDRDTPIKAGDRLIVNLSNGTAQARTVRSVAGRAVTVTTDYGVQPEPELQWAIDYGDLAVQLFRVLKTVRTQEGEYEITALEFNPSKFAAIDTGAKLDERPISIIPVTTVAPPASVSLSSGHMIDQGIVVSTMTIAWPAVQGAVAYDVEWRKDNGNWIRMQRTGATSVDMVGIYAGAYLARVRSVSAFDITSIWKSSQLTQLNGKVGLPPAVTSLTTESLLFGIGVHWTFPPGAEDTQRTELWYSQGTDVSAATKLSDLAYPQSDYVLQNLRAGAAFFFWARLVDRTGNIGPFYPVGVGVRGEASSDAGAILDQIAGQVGESALGKELAAEIGLISGIGPGSVNERLDEANALAEEARARLGEQIAAVDTELAGVKTELQQQIDNIADLADSMPYKADQTYTAGQGSLGADGIIYQAIKAVPVNTPPPNTTYWLNVGQAVATANGLAARVQTVETKVTSVEGVNTSQAQQITGLRTDVDGKASASSVQSIGNRVTTAENSISSQGSAITGLNNSLSTTNTNVSTAQTAANNAAALAGSKGKVLVQTAAPAAADQLAQNLWIDITGGANTPKRWNGSVWAPVTDKVATDAAAAAASALTQVQTKADAAAVSALTNRVTATEGAITTQSSNITNLNNSLSNAGGENLAYNPDFNRAASAANDLPEGYLSDAPNVPGSSTGIFALVPSFMNSAEKAQRITVTGLNVSSLYRSIRNAPNKLPKIAGGQPVCSSIYVRGTPGLGFRIFIQQVTAAGALILTTNTIMYYLTGAQQRIALNVPTPADNAAQLVMFYRVYGSETVSDGFIEMARPQVEYGSTPTGWTNNGQVDAADLIATSNAVASLGSTVSQQGALITSSSQDITTLNNVIYRTGDNNPTRVYQSLFSDLALDKWALDGGNPLSTAKASFSKVAGNTLGATLTLDSTPNLESWWGSTSRRIRFDPTRLYKVTARIQQVSKNGRDPAMYLGVHAYNEDGVQINVSGAPSKVSSHYILAAAAKLQEGVWTTFTTYLKGYSLAGETGGAGAGTVADPKRLIGGTAYFSPMVLTGHPVMGGVAALDFFIIEDATEQNQLDSTSSALQALTSSVTQQGTTLTSVSGRATSLENTINSTSNGLNTKASASAVNDLSNRVSSAEGVLTSQSSDITSLKNTIGSAGSFVAGVSFEFLNSNQGWLPQTAGATMTPGPLFSTLNKYTTVQRNGMAINGSENPFIRFRFKRKNTSRTSGAMYWANQDGGLAEARRANFTITGSEDWQDVEIDLSANTGWVGKTINAIRLDFMNGGDASAIVDLGYVAAGRRSAAASAQAVSALTSEVTQQGATLTSQATQVASLQTAVGNANTAIQTEITARTNADTALGRRVDTVQSSVASANALIQSELSTRANADAALGQRIDTVQSSLGNTNASVQQTSTALAGLNGQVNAQYSVKVMTTTSGMKVAAGFGLGLESEGGVTQSTFAVSADRFVVLNSNLGGGATLSSPFAVENGQVFIADAYIKKATIQQGIVGQGLYSQTFTNYGAPVMNVDFDAGQILIQNRTTNGAYMFIRQDGIFMVQNGVVVVELSMG